MLVFGTRPEAIKMAPLVGALRERPDRFETVVCVSGQHREMLDQVLRLFGIVPDYDLNIMKQGQDLYDITTAVLAGMRGVLAEAKPDVVLVHGDTTTSAAAALAAFYARIPVGHVEAGLRTHDMYNPWPEEINRQLTGRLASFHFAPTSLARENLLREGVPDDRIFVTGNTVIDALHAVVGRIKSDEALAGRLAGELRRVLGRQQPELEVRIARQTVHLPLKKIHYAMAQNHFVKVITDDGECRAAANFAQVQEQLMTQPDFLVCNRGVILNMSKVLRFDGECIEMLDGARLPVRQKDKKSLLAQFTQYQFRNMQRQM